jgi:hypothetical protein
MRKEVKGNKKKFKFLLLAILSYSLFLISYFISSASRLCKKTSSQTYPPGWEKICS